MLSTYPDVLQVHKVIFLSLEVLLMLLQAKLEFALLRCFLHSLSFSNNKMFCKTFEKEY